MKLKSYYSNWKKSSMLFKIVIFLAALFILHQLFLTSKESFKGEKRQAKFETKENDSIYDSFYADIYDSLFSDPIKVKYEMNEIIRSTNIDNDSIILDLGVGTGDHLGYLKENIQCIGLDTSKYMIAKAKKKYPNIVFKQGNALDTMNFVQNQFTHIFMLYFSIYYIQDKSTLFQNMYHWLKPGGYIAIHLVNKHKFDPIVNASNPLIMLSPQRYAKKRITSSEIKFNDFKYKANFKVDKDQTTFEETITDDETGNVRKHIHILYMETQKEILSIATQSGFNLIGKIDLVNCQYEYQYVYILQRPGAN